MLVFSKCNYNFIGLKISLTCVRQTPKTFASLEVANILLISNKKIKPGIFRCFANVSENVHPIDIRYKIQFDPYKNLRKDNQYCEISIN